MNSAVVGCGRLFVNDIPIDHAKRICGIGGIINVYLGQKRTGEGLSAC